MKRTDELKELRGLEVGGLTEKAEALKEELMRMRFRKATGQLDTTARMRTVRQSIARINTVMREKQLQTESNRG